MRLELGGPGAAHAADRIAPLAKERWGLHAPGLPGATGMVLTVAFDYGSRFEMMNAARSARADGSDLNMNDITKRLHDADLPPVDVMIRTSGEIRVSNFLLWQAAGAAIHFTDTAWPDLSASELDTALSLVGAS